MGCEQLPTAHCQASNYLKMELDVIKSRGRTSKVANRVADNSRPLNKLMAFVLNLGLCLILLLLQRNQVRGQQGHFRPIRMPPPPLQPPSSPSASRTVSSSSHSQYQQQFPSARQDHFRFEQQQQQQPQPARSSFHQQANNQRASPNLSVQQQQQHSHGHQHVQHERASFMATLNDRVHLAKMAQQQQQQHHHHHSKHPLPRQSNSLNHYHRKLHAPNTERRASSSSSSATFAAPSSWAPNNVMSQAGGQQTKFSSGAKFADSQAASSNMVQDSSLEQQQQQHNDHIGNTNNKNNNNRQPSTSEDSGDGKLLICYYTTRQTAPYWPKDAREFVVPAERFNSMMMMTQTPPDSASRHQQATSSSSVNVGSFNDRYPNYQKKHEDRKQAHFYESLKYSHKAEGSEISRSTNGERQRNIVVVSPKFFPFNQTQVGPNSHKSNDDAHLSQLFFMGPANGDILQQQQQRQQQSITSRQDNAQSGSVSLIPIASELILTSSPSGGQENNGRQHIGSDNNDNFPIDQQLRKGKQASPVSSPAAYNLVQLSSSFTNSPESDFNGKTHSSDAGGPKVPFHHQQANNNNNNNKNNGESNGGTHQSLANRIVLSSASSLPLALPSASASLALGSSTISMDATSIGTNSPTSPNVMSNNYYYYFNNQPTTTAALATASAVQQATPSSGTATTLAPTTMSHHHHHQHNHHNQNHLQRAKSLQAAESDLSSATTLQLGPSSTSSAPLSPIAPVAQQQQQSQQQSQSQTSAGAYSPSATSTASATPMLASVTNQLQTSAPNLAVGRANGADFAPVTMQQQQERLVFKFPSSEAQNLNKVVDGGEQKSTTSLIVGSPPPPPSSANVNLATNRPLLMVGAEDLLIGRQNHLPPAPPPSTLQQHQGSGLANSALASALASSPLSTMFDVFGAASQYLMRLKPSSLISPGGALASSLVGLSSNQNLVNQQQQQAAANLFLNQHFKSANLSSPLSNSFISFPISNVQPKSIDPTSLGSSERSSAHSTNSSSSSISSSSSGSRGGFLSRLTMLHGGGNNGANQQHQRREEICGRTIQTPERRIIGGEGARYGEFPYQVHIKIAKHQCGGALVDRQSIVTAAHCVYHFITRAPVSKLQIVIGAYDIEDEQYQELPPQYFKVSKVKLHPNFRFSASHPDRYDVAILKLDKPVKYTDNVLPVCLPSKDLKFENMVGTVTGFGKTDPSLSNRYGTRLLQKVDVPIIENNECERWHRTRGIDLKIFPEMMCAGYEDGLKDACVGDSGGPLVVKTPVGSNGSFRWTLAGITSAGFGCAQSRQPGIYHRVSHTVDWILENLD